MCFAWSGAVLPRASCNLGPLAVVAPLLEQMDVAAIIDRHLPPDPQLEYSHGQVLRLLLGARLSQPMALVNVAGWAQESGAEFLWGIPADKLNDDRLGRALDALFSQRHSILASVAAHVVSAFRLPMQRLHYDTTHLLLCGVYDTSAPISEALPLPPTTPSARFPPAHITHGYAVHDAKMIHAGLCSVVDDLGAVPIFGHTLSGNHNGKTLFVFSSADQKVCQQERQRAVAHIRAGLERIALSVASGHHLCHEATQIHRRVAKLLGKRGAARYFRWDLVSLSPVEQAALPTPARGCRRPTHRFVFHYDEVAVQADAADDGYSALLTTAPPSRSADTLFTEFKQQCYVEQGHHQWKTPLAVRPVFLKSPQRVEALVYLLKIALTAYHLLQRLYRQAVPDHAPVAERRLTSESILRVFRVCPLVKEATPLGCVVHPVQLTQRQRTILSRLQFPTPAQTLSRRLPHYPLE